MVTAGMLVVAFLDHSYANASGGVAPTEMRHPLARIDHRGATPCDERGIARPTRGRFRHVPVGVLLASFRQMQWRRLFKSFEHTDRFNRLPEPPMLI